ncbi:MAG: DegT/DnrJ/EryC1/StrS family aminotransferase [Candidatus Firestonebacteria bacterium]|nr:DegT/DnrJ/EryC1/StrS family aminotransferase [Candidatus Firestonebacteria bacterium]
MKIIPMVDLKIQYKNHKKEIDASIQNVLESGRFILGKEVESLEKEVARYLGVKHAVGVSSGTDALFMALMALEIGTGDEVITTPFTFFATAESISLTGAKPVFVDIDPKTYNINVEKIEKAITPHTKAIIPVHLYGQPSDMAKIMDLKNKYNIKIIEDVAQAFSSEYKGKKTGTFGDMSALSFFPSKNLGCYGDGGMIVTDDASLAQKLRMIRIHGDESRYVHVRLGINGRLDSLQAAILRVKLPYLDKNTNLRIEKANLYSKLLLNCEFTLPYKEDFNKHGYNQYTIRLKNRDSLKFYLETQGIETAVHYPIPLHLQKVYKNLGYNKGDFPETEKAALEVLSLPIYPELPEEDINFVCNKICDFIKA